MLEMLVQLNQDFELDILIIYDSVKILFFWCVEVSVKDGINSTTYLCCIDWPTSFSLNKRSVDLTQLLVSSI